MFLARALAQQGTVLLLDEPFTGVDVKPRTPLSSYCALRDEGHLILVSTHNLGSVPEFCDRVILINRTVLAAGPTETTFTQSNLEQAFGGVLRHINLSGPDLHDDNDPRTVTVLTDDERPAVFYGHTKSDPPANSRPGETILMLDLLLQPFSYNYMVKAIWVSAIVGAACAFLSAYLMLKGWSLMGDALSHSVVPGVAGAYALGLPYAAGAFFTGMLAALAMTLVRHITRLREDAIIGFIFSTFFAVGLLIVSLNPTAVNVQSIIFGNILGIADEDVLQVEIIIGVSLLILCLVERPAGGVLRRKPRGVDRPVAAKAEDPVLHPAERLHRRRAANRRRHFGDRHGDHAGRHRLLADRSLQPAGDHRHHHRFADQRRRRLPEFLPRRCHRGVIVTLQTLVFLAAFFFAPKHGLLASRRRVAHSQTGGR